MRTSLTIRPGRSGDIARCREIELATHKQFEAAGHPEFLSSGVIPDTVAKRAIRAGRILVAEINGRVVGWAFLTRSDGELCIGQLAVSPQSQRVGVGTALVDAVIADARHSGERSVVLNTQADVEWNQPWYERIGFEVVPPQRWTTDMAAIAREQTEAGLDWDTRVHMRMRLNPPQRPTDSSPAHSRHFDARRCHGTRQRANTTLSDDPAMGRRSSKCRSGALCEGLVSAPYLVIGSPSGAEQTLI